MICRLNLRDRLFTATKHRLSQNEPVISYLHQALGMLVQPQNIRVGIEELQHISDMLLTETGDKSRGVRRQWGNTCKAFV